MKPHEAYYNEIDPYAAKWVRNSIDKGILPYGVVDERSITDVQPDDLIGFTQCHFFAGIGGWGLATRLAGWPDWREIWTGSCPCQPFSVAGEGRGTDDARHLWPDMFRLIRARRPDAVVGEQVAAAAGRHWLDGVLTDLASENYASRALVLPACAVNAPHRRDRLWWFARNGALGDGDNTRSQGHAGHDSRSERRQVEDRSAAQAGSGIYVADTSSGGCSEGRAIDGRPQREDGTRSFHSSGSNWDTDAWAVGTFDGKARRIEPSIRLLADGLSNRAPQLRAYGNGIVPEQGAEVIAAYADVYPA